MPYNLFDIQNNLLFHLGPSRVAPWHNKSSNLGVEPQEPVSISEFSSTAILPKYDEPEYPSHMIIWTADQLPVLNSEHFIGSCF